MTEGIIAKEDPVLLCSIHRSRCLLLLSKTHEPHHILAEVEWPTIFFFIGLFIIVGGVVKVGLIKWMSLQILELTQGNMFATSMVVMWFSAFASAFIDNIPYVATMNPLVADMAGQLWPKSLRNTVASSSGSYAHLVVAGAWCVSGWKRLCYRSIS